MAQRVRRISEAGFDHAGEAGDVLRVWVDLDHGLRLVRADAGEAFEHFVARDSQRAVFEKMLTEHGGGDRVSVEHSPGSMLGQSGVQQGLGTGFERRFAHGGGVFIDEEELLGLEPAFVEAAAGHEQRERLAADDDAVIAARAERPASAMEIASGLDEIGDFRSE